MSMVSDDNGAETLSDISITPLINSVTSEQLVTENIIDGQLIDFLEGAC